MRKTQNFLRRAGSAALALTLTVSLCQPAFAATKAPFSKDETVYAVMAADGSVTKTTVSEHLYNADGLAGVEDRSTLKNIVNTESFAEYTRNGDTLVWNTDDTDVYYKGDTDRQLPISAKVTYTLDGKTAPLSELLGQSGHLVLTIDLTNNETGKVTVNGKERTIVTPLVTAVGVVLGDDASNVNAVNGLLESAAKSSVAAFVTLPGVKDSLDGLLPEQVNGVAEYLQDSVTVEADVESLTAPQILLACAASAEALGQGNEVFDLDSLNDLTDGIAALNDAMNQLLDGASQLKAGAAQLAAGSLALLDGANQLDSGLGQLTEGLDTLTSNNAALTSGAQQVADGVLDSANQTLMENGLIDTPMTWDTYEAVIDDILSLGDKTLAAGRKKMVRTIWEQAPQFKASQLDIALYLAATRTDHDLEAALRLMQSFSPDFIMGWLKKLTDGDAQQKIHDELVYQTANSEDMASVRALKEKQVRRIILTRPAVEAGESLGFLPGTLNDKVDPYLRPLYDALQEMFGPETYQKLMERGSIEIAPLAYMRGRTLSNAFIILDEAQNTTKEQMKMFLTRMGEGSRMVITGDVTQIDLPDGKASGLKHAVRILKGVEGIATIELSHKDVVRHPLVMRIIKAYTDEERKNEERKNKDVKDG